MNEQISFESLSHIKNRKNNEKICIFLYSSILLTIGISSTSYGASFQQASENLLFVNVYYSIMFTSSSIVMIGMWIYIYKNRFQTSEAAEKGAHANYKLVLSQKGEKVNLYLRLGIIIFGISSLAYIGMRRGMRFRESNFEASIIVYGVIQGSFIIIQTCFVLFNHRLIILTHKKIMKLCFVHLIITNILIWISGSIGKISSDFQKSLFCSKNKYDFSCNLYIYFLPALSEYAVIMIAIMYEFYTRIGKYKLLKFGHKKSLKSKFSVNSFMILSIIAGAVLVLICIFTSISSVVFHVMEIDRIWIFHFHNIEIIILNCLSILILIFAYLNARKFKFSVSMFNNSLDKNILEVSFIFSLNFSILCLFICGYSTLNSSDLDIRTVLIVRIFSGCLEVIQNSIQTHFLIDAFRRCSYSNYQLENKPGRTALAILMGINTGMWFLQSLQIKNADIIYFKDHHAKMYKFLQNSENNVIGLLVRFFLQTTLPLSMLFRYHSAACLSDIYTKMYQTEAKRFEIHLRAGNTHKESQIMSEFMKKSTESVKQVLFENNDVKLLEDPSRGQRSKSVGMIPANTIDHVERKMNRRATIKNMEIAHKQILSTELSLQLFNKKIKTKPSDQYKTKSRVRKMPNIQNMVGKGFFNRNEELYSNDSDNDSAYSI